MKGRMPGETKQVEIPKKINIKLKPSAREVGLRRKRWDNKSRIGKRPESRARKGLACWSFTGAAGLEKEYEAQNEIKREKKTLKRRGKWNQGKRAPLHVTDFPLAAIG